MSGIVGSKLNIRGSGRIAKLGTDGQVLTSAGAGLQANYEDAAGGGAWTLISTETLGADVTPWDIDDIFTSTYDIYKMFITDFSCTGSGASSYVDAQLLVSGTAQTGDYRTLYSQAYALIEGANTVYGVSGGDWATAIRFEDSARNNDVGTATDYLGQFEFTFYRPQDSVVNNQGSFMSTVCTGSATYNNYVYNGSWMYTSAVAATGVRFIANNGDMSAGSIVRTYGISS